MTRMTDEELRQEIEDLVKRQVEERSLIPSHEDPREFGRRFARETFEKRMEEAKKQVSKEGDAA